MALESETAGDSLFAAFSESGAAVRFAISAQQKISNHDWQTILSGVKSVRIRIGMHSGEPHIGWDEVYGRPFFRGSATNRAARVQSAAHGGQILLSNATKMLVAPTLPPETTLLDCGYASLERCRRRTIVAGVSSRFAARISAFKHSSIRSAIICRFRCRRWWAAKPKLRNGIRLLQQPTTRVLTLCAFGGMGKTRTALQLAENCAAEANELWKNGVWWVALEEARSP